MATARAMAPAWGGWRRAVALGMLAGMLAGPAPARAREVPFRYLDGRIPPLANVMVTAMAFGGHGLVYAAGRYIVPQTEQLAPEPYYAAGSVFLVSRDDGAHWDERLTQTNPRAMGNGLVAMPWTNHALLPTDFAAMAIAIDPGRPNTLWATGCVGGVECPGALQGHSVLVSRDGGATWGDALVYRLPATMALPTLATIQTNIRKTTSLLNAILVTGGPISAAGIAFGPRGRVYVCAQGLGVLYTDNDARSWQYPSQPLQNRAPCEVAAAPGGRTVYRLSRQGILYRSPDAATTFSRMSTPGVGLDSNGLNYAGNLAPDGRTLYLTTIAGVERSTDGGTHFAVVIPSPAHVFAFGAVEGAGGWVAGGGARDGMVLMVARARGAWSIVVRANSYGAGGALDDQGVASGTRLWEDRQSRIVFRTGGTGGLFRWQSGV